MRQTLNWYHRSAALRCRYGIELENPFLEDVKKTYPAVFSACFAAGSVIYPKVTGEELSENEVSYLSLLIGGAIVRSEKKISAVVICNGCLLYTSCRNTSIPTWFRLPCRQTE